MESILLISNASIHMTEYYYSMLTKTKEKKEYEDSDYDDDEDIVDENMEYVKDKLDNIRKNNKRLH